MKTFITTWVAIIATLFPTLVFGGLPPTRSGGQSGTLSTTFDFKTPYNQVTKYSGTGGLIETGSYQIAKNPGFEAQTYSTSWATTGGTLAAATSTNIFFSKGATWNSSAASQEFSSDLATVPEGFVGNNCEGSIYIKVPSGTATHTIRVVDNSSNVKASATVINSTYFTKNTLNFPCPASGTSIALQIISVASDEPLIALDEAYLGLARNVGVADLETEWTSFTPTIVNGGTTSSSVGRWRQNGPDMLIEYVVVFSGTGSASTLGFDIPNSKARASYTNTNDAIGDGIWFDSGTAEKDLGVAYLATTRLCLVPDNSGGCALGNAFASGDIVRFSARVPILGWAASTVVMPDAQGWFASGTISGTNPSLTAGDVTAYTEITNASLTLTPDSGSAAMGIMCSGTNAATSPSSSATTCAAGSESVGASINVPRSGQYEACFDFAHNVQVDSAETLYSVFNVIQTPTNAQTLTQEGGPRVQSGHAAMTTSGTASPVFPVNACGLLTLSAGQVGIRLMYEQATGGTPNVSQIYGDAGASFGQRSIRIRIRPVSQQQQAVLANSVSTGRTNGDKVGSVRLDCDAASTIVENPQSMVSSIGNISGGTCVATFATGYFSAKPICTVSWDGNSTAWTFYSVCTSATSCNVGGGGAVTTAQIHMNCIGPR